MYKATAIITEALKEENIAFVTYQKTEKTVFTDEVDATKSFEVTEDIDVIETILQIDNIPDVVFRYKIYNNKNQIEIETGDIMSVPKECISHVLESLNQVNSKTETIYDFYLTISDTVRMGYSIFDYTIDDSVRDIAVRIYMYCKKEIEENLAVLYKALEQID